MLRFKYSWMLYKARMVEILSALPPTTWDHLSRVDIPLDFWEVLACVPGLANHVEEITVWSVDVYHGRFEPRGRVVAPRLRVLQLRGSPDVPLMPGSR